MNEIRTVALWVEAHWATLLAVWLTVNALLRAIPAATWDRLEVRFPRVGHAIRATIAAGPDVVKFALALFGVVTGRPWAPLAADLGLGRGPYRTPGDPSGGDPTPPVTGGKPPTVPPVVTGALFALTVGAVLLVGCPTRNRPRCETPHVYRCTGDMAEVCSPAPDLQWTRVGDRPCGEAIPGTRCTVVDGLAGCVAVDAGREGGTP